MKWIKKEPAANLPDCDDWPIIVTDGVNIGIAKTPFGPYIGAMVLRHEVTHWLPLKKIPLPIKENHNV